MREIRLGYITQRLPRAPAASVCLACGEGVGCGCVGVGVGVGPRAHLVLLRRVVVRVVVRRRGDVEVRGAAERGRRAAVERRLLVALRTYAHVTLYGGPGDYTSRASDIRRY